MRSAGRPLGPREEPDDSAALLEPVHGDHASIKYETKAGFSLGATVDRSFGIPKELADSQLGRVTGRSRLGGEVPGPAAVGSVEPPVGDDARAGDGGDGDASEDGTSEDDVGDIAFDPSDSEDADSEGGEGGADSAAGTGAQGGGSPPDGASRGGPGAATRPGEGSVGEEEAVEGGGSTAARARPGTAESLGDGRPASRPPEAGRLRSQAHSPGPAARSGPGAVFPAKNTEEALRGPLAEVLPPWQAALDGIVSPSLRLHVDVCEAVRRVSATPAEVLARSLAIERVERLAQSAFPGCQLLPFGSSATGLVLPGGDVDGVLVDTGHEGWTGTVLHALSRILTRAGVVSAPPCVIAHARVPIVKFVERASGIPFDISVGGPGDGPATGGPGAASTTRRMLRCYPPLRPLALVVKLFLQQRGMHEVRWGGMGSYALVLSIASFLKSHRSLRGVAGDGSAPGAAVGAREADAARPDGRDPPPALTWNLGVLLAEYFAFMGADRGQGETPVAIRANGPTSFFRIDGPTSNYSARTIEYNPAGNSGWKWGPAPGLHIQDANDNRNSVARGSLRMDEILRAFEAALHRMLQPSAIGESLLARVLRLEPPLVGRDPSPWPEEADGGPGARSTRPGDSERPTPALAAATGCRAGNDGKGSGLEGANEEAKVVEGAGHDGDDASASAEWVPPRAAFEGVPVPAWQRRGSEFLRKLQKSPDSLQAYDSLYVYAQRDPPRGSDTGGGTAANSSRASTLRAEAEASLLMAPDKEAARALRQEKNQRKREEKKRQEAAMRDPLYGRFNRGPRAKLRKEAAREARKAGQGQDEREAKADGGVEGPKASATAAGGAAPVPAAGGSTPVSAATADGAAPTSATTAAVAGRTSTRSGREASRGPGLGAAPLPAPTPGSSPSPTPRAAETPEARVGRRKRSREASAEVAAPAEATAPNGHVAGRGRGRGAAYGRSAADGRGRGDRGGSGDATAVSERGGRSGGRGRGRGRGGVKANDGSSFQSSRKRPAQGDGGARELVGGRSAKRARRGRGRGGADRA